MNIYTIQFGLYLLLMLGIGYNDVAPLAGMAGPEANAERIFLALTTALFHPVFGGFVLAAVLAAVMSTADSQLLVFTSSLTEDLPFFQRMNEKSKAWISRFGAAFGPLILLSLLWRGTTKHGALAGMIVGAATIFIVKNYIQIEGEYLYELLPGFILAFIIHYCG